MPPFYLRVTNIYLKKNLVYKFTPGEPGVKEGYPKKINEEFPNMPENIDAFTKYDNKYYVIKGIQFYIVENDKKINLGTGENKYPQYLDTKFSDLKTAADRTNIINNVAVTTISSN